MKGHIKILIFVLMIFILNTISTSIAFDQIAAQFLPNGMSIVRGESYIEGVVFLCIPLSIIFQSLFGSWSDRYGRIKFLLVTNMIMLCFCILGYFAEMLSSSFLMGLSFLCLSVGMSGNSVLLAIICDISRGKRRLLYFAIVLLTTLLFFTQRDSYLTGVFLSALGVLLVYPLSKYYTALGYGMIQNRFHNLSFFQHLVRVFLVRKVWLSIGIYALINLSYIAYAQLMYGVFVGETPVTFSNFYYYAFAIFSLGIVCSCFAIFWKRSSHYQLLTFCVGFMALGLIYILLFRNYIAPEILTLPFSFMSGVAAVYAWGLLSFSTNKDSYGLMMGLESLVLQLCYVFISVLFNGSDRLLSDVYHYDIYGVWVLIAALLLAIYLIFRLKIKAK